MICPKPESVSPAKPLSSPVLDLAVMASEPVDLVRLLGQRHYDPTPGRFLSQDSYEPPPGDMINQNLYNFGGANPVTYTDPSGNFALGAMFAAGTSLGGSIWGGTSLRMQRTGASFGLDPDSLRVGKDVITDALLDVVEWIEDRPPGASEGYESFIPVWGSLKDSMANFMDGRWGWGAFHGVMALADALFVGQIATAVGRLGLQGTRRLLQKAVVDVAVDRASERGRYISLTPLGGSLGAYDHVAGKILVDRAMHRELGESVRETVRHEVVHKVLSADPRSLFAQKRNAVSFAAYEKSHAIRAAEEFVAELYGTQNLSRAWELINGSGYAISWARVAGETSAYVATVATVSYGASFAGGPLGDWLAHYLGD